MYKYITSFFAVVFFWLSSFTLLAIQPTDSRIEWFESFFVDTKPVSTEQMLKETNAKLRQAIHENDKIAQARAHKELGLINISRTHAYDQAMDHFINALTIEDSLVLKEESVFTYLAIAKVFEETSDYDKSANALEEARLLNKDNNIEVLIFILSKLGEINAARGKLDEAAANFELVLQHEDEISWPQAKAEALFHQAHIYTKKGEYEKSLRSHKNALAIRRSIKDRHQEAQSLNDIGELYRLMKNNDRVLANHAAALSIRLALQDKPGIAQSQNNIGILYYEQKQYDSSIVHLNLALAAGQEAQAQLQLSRSYDYLTLNHKAIGDFEQALRYKELYVAINEFIQRESSDRQIFETQNQYEVGKKQTEIDKLEAIRKQRDSQLATQKKIRNFLYLVSALSLLVVVLIIYLYRQKQRSNTVLKAAHEKVNQQNKELQELNATKDKFFSIISHDLKGPLNSLTSFSNLLINYYESLSKEEVQTLAKDFDKSLKNLFALLENLLEWSRSQTGNIEFTPEVFNLGALLEENRLLLDAQAQNKKIHLLNACENDFNVSAHKHSVNTVVRNLVSNAIKFTPEGGLIKLELMQVRNEVIVSISDTGVGMKPEIMEKLFRIDVKHSTKGTANEKGTGLGLVLCKEFIEKNGGRIWVESEIDKGSVFSFSLPYLPVTIPAKQEVLA